MVDTFVKEGVPVLKAVLQDLEEVPSDWKGLVLLSAEEYPVDEDVHIDLADVLYARAGIEAAIGLAYFAHGYDLTIDWKKGRETVDYQMRKFLAEQTRFMSKIRNAPSLVPEFTAKTWSRILQNSGVQTAHQTVAIKLDLNGGKLPKGSSASVSLHFDEDSEENIYPELPVPARAGFIFIGWATAKEYAFQGYLFKKGWNGSYPSFYEETAATWKIENWVGYCCGLSTSSSYPSCSELNASSGSKRKFIR